jgi:hypothetical protein
VGFVKSITLNLKASYLIHLIMNSTYIKCEEDWNPQALAFVLKEIDRAIAKPVGLHYLGAIVITLPYSLERSTANVDVISVTPRLHGKRFA